MIIRILKKKDRNKIASILINYWNNRGMHYPLKWTRKYLISGHKIEIISDKFFVIEEEKQIIGCISLIIYEGNVGEIRDFIIKKGFRKRGFGLRILEEFLSMAKKKGVRKIYALIFPINITLYSKLGFIKEGYLKDHFIKNEDLIIISKLL